MPRRGLASTATAACPVVAYPAVEGQHTRASERPNHRHSHQAAEPNFQRRAGSKPHTKACWQHPALRRRRTCSPVMSAAPSSPASSGSSPNVSKTRGHAGCVAMPRMGENAQCIPVLGNSTPSARQSEHAVPHRPCAAREDQAAGQSGRQQAEGLHTAEPRDLIWVRVGARARSQRQARSWLAPAARVSLAVTWPMRCARSRLNDAPALICCGNTVAPLT
jgi:hypothetical protein